MRSVLMLWEQLIVRDDMRFRVPFSLCFKPKMLSASCKPKVSNAAASAQCNTRAVSIKTPKIWTTKVADGVKRTQWSEVRKI